MGAHEGDRVLPSLRAALALIAAAGLLVSAYLELFVLRAICQWCVASATLVIAYLVLGALCLRDLESDVPEAAGGR